MKLVQFTELQEEPGRIRLGVMNSENILCELDYKGTMKDLIAEIGTLEEAKVRIEHEIARCQRARSIADVKLCAPITNPEKMIFVGLNYVDHAAESNMKVPEKPVLFSKYNNSIIGSEDVVLIPEEVKKCDYEVELAVIIGKTAKHVPETEAMNYVFGYTIANDVSARDIQLSEGQWTRGKAIDTFAPIGPWIVTADEIADPHQLNISLTLNGEMMQQANTRDLIFNIPFLVSFLSRTITLVPGDIISTGTPPGVGLGRNPQVWLKEGDVTKAKIEGIGVLRNTYKSI